MKNRQTLLFTLSIISLTSCSLFSKKVWSWEESTKDDTIKYCLLIGQLDHSDSITRTQGVREILHTRVDKEHQLANCNLENPVEGYIDIPEAKLDGKTIPAKRYKVKEIEHLEQKSMSGATWDPITANSSAATWISKHGKDITFFVSNNDGMAEGASKASNWYEGMPIMGYDANISALKLIRENKMIGTVDATTYAQCLASSLLIRNITEHEKSDNDDYYNPTVDGFSNEHSLEDYGSGYIHSDITFDGCDLTKEDERENGNHALMVKNRAISYDKIIDPETGKQISYAAKSFFNEDGSEKAKKQIFDEYEGSKVDNPIKVDSSAFSELSVWQSWYNASDVFFTGNMNPYFDIVQASDMFNFNIVRAEGNGSDESSLLNSLSSALSKDSKPKAYLINPVQPTNSMQYINKIAEAFGIEEKEDWRDRSPIPIVFWNRQPTDRDGNVDHNVMNNKYFKYTYYIGNDAKQGGELQGECLKYWITYQYRLNYKG